MRRFELPADCDPSHISAAIGPGRRLILGPTTPITRTHLDTFDWRLHRAGLSLVEEKSNGTSLRLTETGREDYVVRNRPRPRLADDLPDGHLAARVAPLIGVRSLIDAGVERVERREGRIEDGEGNLVTRVRTEASVALDTSGEPACPPRSTLLLDPHSPPELVPGLATATGRDLDLAASARGRSPGDYSSKLDIRLEPDQPAEAALRTILFDLLDTLEANVQGTIDDLDTEFLHDLRVACRRTRSALTQLKGILPTDEIAPFNAEFKWLGGATGELRDLDVYLLEMPTTRSLLPADIAGHLEPLERLIRTSRRRAHRSVARVLRSARFRRLVRSWRGYLEGSEATTPSETAGPVVRLANTRISKAYKRIIKRGSGLGEDPPAAALHRLRIDAKKLRYLLEFFKALYSRDEIVGRIKELKRLQDILGGFNDMEVQRDRLTGFARELRDDPAVDADHLLTLGRLAAALEDRQEGFRLAFHDAFVEFSSDDVSNAYRRLFGRREST
jgi:CHAD domain-containing protein